MGGAGDGGEGDFFLEGGRGGIGVLSMIMWVKTLYLILKRDISPKLLLPIAFLGGAEKSYQTTPTFLEPRPPISQATPTCLFLCLNDASPEIWGEGIGRSSVRVVPCLGRTRLADWIGRFLLLLLLELEVLGLWEEPSPRGGRGEWVAAGATPRKGG